MKVFKRNCDVYRTKEEAEKAFLSEPCDAVFNVFLHIFVCCHSFTSFQCMIFPFSSVDMSVSSSASL